MPSTTRPLLLIGALLALLALLLAGCPRPARPTPTPAIAPAITPVPATAAPVTPTPAAALPDGWTVQQTEALTIRLPADWRPIDFTAGDAQTIFADLEERDPELARIIGSPEALEGAAFWAFRTVAAPTSFADNLNIRRTPLNGQRIEDMQVVLDPVVAQYQELGFQILATDAKLSIGGLPAASIAFSFEINTGGGKPASVQGHQYLVAAETDLWILSYSAGPAAALAPIFRESALSFRVK